MNKYKLFAALLAVALIASGCGAEKQAETDNEMYIEQAQLTDEESNLLSMVKADRDKTFDFRTDETVKSVKINIYELKSDGNWRQKNSSEGYTIYDNSGRIALVYDSLSGEKDISIDTGDSMTSVHYQGDGENSFDGLVLSDAFLSEKTVIECEKEIPLALQIYSYGNADVYGAEQFYRPDELKQYEHVYAVTAVFS